MEQRRVEDGERGKQEEHDKESVYEPRSILVTGGAGFIASWLVRGLLEKYGVGTPLVVVDRLDACSYPHNWGVRPCNWPEEAEPLESEPDAGGRVTTFRKLDLEPRENFFFHRGDIRNDKELVVLMAQHGIDTVLHLAAQTHVDDSFDSGHLYIEDNILGTHNLLRACKIHGRIRRFVHVSTDEVQSGVQEKLTGDDHFTVTNAYAATKAGAELICRAFAFSHGIPILITRCNNVYGPGHGSHPIKVIPKFITALLQGHKLTVHGNGEAKRNYIHVLDVVQAFLLILSRGEVGRVYGIGTTTEISILQLIQRLVPLVLPGASPNSWLDHVTFIPDRPFQDPRYHVNTQALTLMGWREQISFEDGLKQVVDWYRAHHKATNTENSKDKSDNSKNPL